MACCCVPHLALLPLPLAACRAPLWQCAQVKQLLQSAKDADALLTVLPSLLEPRNCISVLVSVRKWYFNKRDPVEVIEADPELILRAQVGREPQGAGHASLCTRGGAACMLTVFAGACAHAWRGRRATCRLTPCTWRRTACLRPGSRTTKSAPTGRPGSTKPCTSRSDAQHAAPPARSPATCQAVGVAFEPVFQDAAGNWEAPDFAYLERRAGWQKYLDEKLKKRDYLQDAPLAPQQQPQPAADAAPDGQPAPGTPPT